MTKRKKKYLTGGEISGIGNLAANIVDAKTYNDKGVQSQFGAGLSGALKGAGTGASIGSVIPGVGTLIGGGVGAVIGMGTSLMNQKKQQEELYKAELLEEQNRMDIAAADYKNQMSGLNKGTRQTTMFEKGGKLPLDIIGMNTVKVKGKKHEQGGVNIGVAEVEKDEIIHGDKVFSARLKVPGTAFTYAAVADKIVGKPKYKTLADKMETSNIAKMDTYRAGTLVRNMQKAEKPLNDLFNMQESMKKGSGRKMAYGGKLKLELGGTTGMLDYEDPLPVKGVKAFQNYLLQNKDNVSKALEASKLVGNPLANLKAPERTTPTLPETGIKAFQNVMEKNPELKFLAGKDLNRLTPMGNRGYATVERTAPVVNEDKKPNLSFTGSDLRRGFEAVAPYMDNITNAFLTQRSPVLPTPRLNTPARIKTNYNIEPQLAEIARSEVGTKRNILDNVSDGAAARGSLLANRFNSLNAKANLLGQKENIETDFKNRQSMMNADVLNQNRGIMNNYDMLKFQRADDIQTRISQNAANATEDAQQQIVDRKLSERDEMDLAITLRKYQNTGVLERLNIPLVRKYISQGMTADEAIAKVKAGNPPGK